ncbi:hypothetical protein [Azospirillum sp. sgz301742]
MSRPALLLAAALLLGAAPSMAQSPQKNQQTDACRHEAERFEATITGPERANRNAEPDTAPGARAGKTLTDEDRQRLRRHTDEARAAADRGDAEGCLRNLREARTAAREAGFGGGAGGSAAPSQGSSGSSGSGSLNTNTAGSRPPGAPRAAGSNAGSVGGSAGGSAGSSGR